MWALQVLNLLLLEIVSILLPGVFAAHSAPPPHLSFIQTINISGHLGLLR